MAESSNDDAKSADSMDRGQNKSEPEQQKYAQPQKPKIDLKRLFLELTSTGDFCVAGSITLPWPALSIDEVGLISFPLLASTVETIKQACQSSESPKTLEAKTFYDIHPSKLKISNPEWHKALHNLVRGVAIRLGTNPEYVQASLSRLVLQEPGAASEQNPQQRKEVRAEVFAKLVVHFPSERLCGGEYVVRHGGVERVFGLGADDGSSAYDFFCAAHFAACDHEVRPIASGARLAAEYLLSFTGKDGAPPSPPWVGTAAQLAQHLPNLKTCLGWMLQGAYSRFDLLSRGCLALSGRDRVVADALLTARDLVRQAQPEKTLSVYIFETTKTGRSGWRGLSDPALCLQVRGGARAEEDFARAEPGLVSQGALKSLRFDEDLIGDGDNTKAKEKDERVDENEEDYDHEDSYKPYYVLAVVRKDRELRLCIETVPHEAVRAATSALPRHPEQTRAILAAFIEAGFGGKFGPAAKVSAELLGLTVRLNDAELLRGLVAVLPLAIFWGEGSRRVAGGGCAFVRGLASKEAANEFAAAAAHFGAEVFDRLGFVETASEMDHAEHGVYVVGAPGTGPGGAPGLACHRNLCDFMDHLFQVSACPDPPPGLTAHAEQIRPAHDGALPTACARLCPFLTLRGALHAEGFARALGLCEAAGNHAGAAQLLGLLAVGNPASAVHSDGRPDDRAIGVPLEVAEAVAKAVGALAWGALEGPVRAALEASRRSERLARQQLAGRLTVLFRVLEEMKDAELVGKNLASFVEALREASDRFEDIVWVGLMVIRCPGFKSFHYCCKCHHGSH